jgi:hypothetical protein
MDLLPPRAWEDAAACDLDDAYLFELKPAPGETPAQWRRRLTAAVELCRRCPVARQCLDDAVLLDDRGHIRGGWAIPVKTRHPRPVAELIYPRNPPTQEVA